jgi:uncharacterized protein YaaR (DUF327 family)
MKIIKTQSEVLQAALDRLEGYAEVNREYMDADDYGDLQATIKELHHMKNEAMVIEYKSQVKQFIDYLEGSLFDTQDDEDAWQKWTSMPYTITHGDKSVVIDNFAEVYDRLLHLLKEHYNDL